MFNYKSLVAMAATIACTVIAQAKVIVIRDGAAINLGIETKGRNLYDIKGHQLTDKDGVPVVLRAAQKGETLLINVKAVGHNGKVVVFDAQDEDMIGARLSVMQDESTFDDYSFIADEAVIQQAQEFLAAYRDESKGYDVSQKSWAKKATNGSWLNVGKKEDDNKKSVFDGVLSVTTKGSKIIVLENRKCGQFTKWMNQRYYSPQEFEITNTKDEQLKLAKLRMTRKDHAFSKNNASKDFYKFSHYDNRVYNFGFLNKTNKMIAIGQGTNLGKCLGVDLKAASFAKNVCVELDFPNSEVNFDEVNCPALKNVEVYKQDGIYNPFNELYRDLKSSDKLQDLDAMFVNTVPMGA